MIQFNLLPDVKLEYIKARRLKRLVISISTIAGIAAITIMLILVVVVDVWQKKSIGDTNRDIAKYSSQIKSTPNLNKILTVQNQLNSLPFLDDSKPQVSRLFGYISQLTPQTANISNFTLDLTANTINIQGTADSVSTINKYVDTLKFTTYQTSSAGGTTSCSSNSSNPKAFSKVVLSSFSLGSSGSAGASSPPSYTITASVDPIIFKATDNVTLTVPCIISTRSAQEQPAVLFAPQPSNSQSNSSGKTQ